MRLFPLIIVALFVLPLHDATAQIEGNCAASVGEGQLDVGNVVARVLNNGMLAWNGNPNRYEVPKGSGHNTVFAASLHLGVEAGDDFRIAATAYGPAEFWSGPLPKSGVAPDSLHCKAFDRVWEVRREEIERYRQDGQTTAAMETWPYQIGAPVSDGDGIPGNYNLAGGDVPAILGDQTLWWVMNDRGNRHPYTGSDPTGLEVRAEAFAFSASGILGNSTFYRYEIKNPTGDSLMVYAGLFLDGRSGAWGDDYAGTDTSLSMVYVYGGDDADDVFGSQPPALGAAILKAPTVDGRERRIGASQIPPDDGGRLGWPSDAAGYHNFVRGLIKDGDPIREGGWGGGQTGPTTRFAFPGDPVSGAFWSMVDTGTGSTWPIGPESFTYAEPFPLMPGDSEEIIFALVWAQGASRFDSIVRLREGVTLLRHQRASLLERLRGDGIPETSFVLGLSDNYPNPFSTTTTIRASIPQRARVRLEVFDLLGRSVALLQNGDLDKGEYSWEFNGANLPSGVYFYRFRVDSYTFSKLMVLAR